MKTIEKSKSTAIPLYKGITKESCQISSLIRPGENQEVNVSCSVVRGRGTSKQIKRVWLLTWESSGDHAQVEDRFVAIISSRFKTGG
jgi:hypothetical protein